MPSESRRIGNKSLGSAISVMAAQRHRGVTLFTLVMLAVLAYSVDQRKRGLASLTESDCSLELSADIESLTFGDVIRFDLTVRSTRKGRLQIYASDADTWMIASLLGEVENRKPFIVANRSGRTQDIFLSDGRTYTKTLYAKVTQLDDAMNILLDFGELGSIRFRAGAKIGFTVYMFAANHDFSDSADGVGSNHVIVPIADSP